MPGGNGSGDSPDIDKALATQVDYRSSVAALVFLLSILTLGSPDLTPSFHFTPHDCFIWQVYQGVATVLVFAAVDYVLILRGLSSWHSLLEFTGMCVGLGLSLPGIQFDNICLTTSVSSALLIYAGSTLLFQTFLFALTAYKFVQAVREGWGDTPLLSLVMRDGTWAFFLLFGQFFLDRIFRLD
ncbi:hypothetical protein B0H16DRAFT_1494344 [Mycena metata]|uniref:Uncharacterized protein n=1 Tax=Mycena metata TaxID=1033252 RepID=A0AAD7KDZ8_9AGAR|nr:hypothetical protein B0H16DRAFT_1494344 [Mycena metata]